MANLFVFLLSLYLTIWVNAHTDVVIREYIWQNFNDFRTFGWAESVNGKTRTFSTPSEVNSTLYELNKNFTDEVWGLQPTNDGYYNRLNYSLDLGSKPEYCGLINATMSLKFYLRENEINSGYDGSYIYPACSTSGKCLFSNSKFATWNTTKQEIVLSKSKTIVISMRLRSTGMFLLDEVRLTYAVRRDLNCSDPCDNDCDYMGIDCNNYYTCINRRYKDFRTCDKQTGLAFNPITKSCDLEENVEGCHGPTTPPTPNQCVCEFTPHEDDCSLYYFCPDTCHLDKCELRRCPSGLLWSLDSKGDGSSQQQCVLPSKAVCFNSTITITTAISALKLNTAAIQENLNMAASKPAKSEQHLPQQNPNNGAVNEIIFREDVWNNFRDFLAYGWTESVNKTTQTYPIPSTFSPRLYELNDNYTEEVWGWRPSDAGRTSLAYSFDLESKPEHCGIINATLVMKFYLRDNLAGNHGSHVYPSFTSDSCQSTQCRLNNSVFGAWSIKTFEVNLSVSRKLQIYMWLQETGLILFDQVRLIYAVQPGVDCPYSCNSDCDYRGIDCHNYYTCIDQRYKEFRTCNKSEGLAFNPRTKSCDLMDNVEGCEGLEPPPQNCVCEFRPNVEDCSKYYFCPDTCHMDQCEERRCPGNLLWSMDANNDGSGQQQCVHPSTAVCYDEWLTTTVEPDDET